MKLKVLLPSLLIVAASIVLAFVFNRYVLRRFTKLAKRTKWKIDDILISTLASTSTLFFIILGLHISLKLLPLPPNISDILGKATIALVILTCTLAAIKIAVGFIRYYGETVRAIALPTTTIFVNLTKAILGVIGGLIILQTLGISITPLVTALGIGGLAVALALQDTLSNFFSGLHIILSGQVKVGDFVKLESGEEGYIQDIGWRNTTMLMLPENLVVIPNSKLASAIVTNYSYPKKELNVYIDVGVSYSSDLDRVEEVTLDVAREVLREVPGGVPSFEPIMRYKEFGDSSINFLIILRARDYVSQFLVRHEFIKRLHRRYNQEGIEIPFPIRTVYLKNEG